MSGLYYEEFEIGMEFKHALTRTVTEMDNIMFCAMTHNPQPLHLDEEYSKNTFYALKVIFANQMFDICDEMGEDWYGIKDVITAEQSQPIGESHLDPIFGLNRGFGGKCLPKDTLALTALADRLGVKYEILDSLFSDNQRLRRVLTGKESDVATLDD